MNTGRVSRAAPRRQRGGRRWALAGMLLLAVASAIALCVYLQRAATALSAAHKAAADSDAIVLVTHHPDKPGRVHEPDTAMDACRILQGCYPGENSIFTDRKTCHENMPWILRSFTSSALRHRGQVVGFVSFEMSREREGDANVAIMVYNVCVDPALRSRGLARRLMQEGVEEMLDHHRLRGHNVLLGLDVNLTSEMAAVAFSIYAKLGFVRAWQPCHSVGDVDWRPLFKPGHAATRSPLARLLADPDDYVRRVLSGTDTGPLLPSLSSPHKRVPDHYCMFKFYAESWHSMGTVLAAPFQPPPRAAGEGTL